MTTSKELITFVKDEARLAEIRSSSALKEVLNHEPNRNWVKKHPYANNVNYLPIDKVELLLDLLFESWRVEILSVQQLAQSIVCTVRLHYKNNLSGDWSFHDGVGAVPLKTKRGSSPADMSAILNDAVATGAPAAKSFAIKDAAEHLGKLFGRDLNRADTVAFVNLFSTDDSNSEERDDTAAVDTSSIKNAKSLDELKSAFVDLYTANRHDSSALEIIVKAKDARKDELIR